MHINLADVNEVEVGWGVCERAGAGVVAHAPGGRGVFVTVRLSRLVPCRFVDTPSELPVSSSDDEGGPGRSGRPLGGGGVSNSILEVLRDGRGGVESSKEGAVSNLSIGVAADDRHQQKSHSGWLAVMF